MNFSFKRITSSGNFIPEIDGLRFIAITSIILVHISSYLSISDTHHYSDSVDYSLIMRLLSHGRHGVILFFVISGFILGMPFAKFFLLQEKRLNLKNYYLRRLTRLEPPYMLVMTILFVSIVFLYKSMPVREGFESYLSSVFYLHNFIYPGTLSKLNGVTWSLEIEIQFYILAPLMAYIFAVKVPSLRRLSIIAVAILFLIVKYVFHFHFLSLLNFIQYFFIGFLLADLYLSNATILPVTKFDTVFCFIFFCIIWLYDKKELKNGIQMFAWEFIQMGSIFFFYYYVLIHKVFKVLSNKLITNIGGMCYSIYLLHLAIISALGRPILQFSFSQYSFINTTFYSILLIGGILLVSAVFFLLVERPCMDKNWYKNVLRKHSRKVISEVA